MKLVFSEQAWADYLHWQATDRRMLERVNTLLREIARQPFQGIGKPEPLRHALKGYWSRRIDAEHRLVYKIEADCVLIAQVRLHY
ncbi:MAG: Txe/YoeB family addiction module toxin [Thermoanaerobaculia bacterium]|nr:Txe/YoeB family addiction module toxin [Thermoanaerobaculia bacterium]